MTTTVLPCPDRSLSDASDCSSRTDHLLPTQWAETLKNNLTTLNQKERFLLVAEVIGTPSSLALSDRFVAKLTHSLSTCGIHLSQSLPPLFVGIDYHFDWMYAALELSWQGQDIKHLYQYPTATPLKPLPNKNRLISGNQEDADLLIVCTDVGEQPKTYFILIEAKGVGRWSTKQLRSKARRIRSLFGPPHAWSSHVQPVIVLAGPRMPGSTTSLDDPAGVYDIPICALELSLPKPLAKVTRCNGDGRQSVEGGHWKVQYRRRLPFSTDHD